MSMELLLATAIGAMTSVGIYLLFQRRTFPVVIGLCFLSYAVNVFLFAMGRLVIDLPPIISKSATAYTDPLPQALVLTAIVISFATTALFLVVLIVSRGLTGTDHVDGGEREP
jgi:multicomponent K+:H+ antiporter subunit C